MPGLETIRPIIEEKLARMGIELYDLKFHPAGPASVMRVYIDKEGGVTIDDCENVSNEISMLLDVENFSAAKYRLEVSSPGADRLLRSEKDFKRALGRNIRAQVAADNGRERTVTGTIERCEGGILHLRNKNEPVEIPVSQIKYGKIEFSFN